MNNITFSLSEIKAELARRKAWEFCLFMDYDFFSERPFLEDVANLFQWLIQKENTPLEVINSLRNSQYLEKFSEKKIISKGSVSMPPRAGKSYTTSICSAWGIAKNNKESILRCAATSRLFNKFSYDTRKFFQIDKFREVFPNIKLSGDKQNVTAWNVEGTKQGSYFGAGTGASIIGIGASLIAITDDLFSGIEQAQNDEQAEKVMNWHKFDFDSRLEKECPELDIGTRWRADDVIGSRTENGEYDVIIRIPALIKNKSFCENVKTTAEYLKKEKELDPVLFMPMYQQQPIESKGLLFPKTKLNYFDINELNRVPIITLAWIDTSGSGTDNFSMPICKVYRDGFNYKIYITDVIYNKDDMEINEPLCAEMINNNRISEVGYEMNQFGKYGAKNLQKLVRAKIRTKFETANKHYRIVEQSSMIRMYVYFRNDNGISIEYKNFMGDIYKYLKSGKSKNKVDAPDSLAGLMWLIRSKLNF